MMKWLWAVIAMFAFAAAWQAQTPGMLGLCLLVGIVAVVASFLGFVTARIASVSSAQMNRESALLATVKGGANRASARSRDDAGTAAFVGTGVYGATFDDAHRRDEGADHARSDDFGGSDFGTSDGGGSYGGGGGDGGGGGGGD